MRDWHRRGCGLAVAIALHHACHQVQWCLASSSSSFATRSAEPVEQPQRRKRGCLQFGLMSVLGSFSTEVSEGYLSTGVGFTPIVLQNSFACTGTRNNPGGRRTADKRDELAPFHSRTSSARSRKVSGIVKPIALAALRLTTSLNCVGFCTARSEGLAPLRIRSTYSATPRN